MERVTRDMLDRAFQAFVDAGENAGFPATERWRLDIGSRVNGIAYRVYSRDPDHGGHDDLPYGLTSSSGFVGMTAREAFDTLHTMRRAVSAVTELRSRPRV